MPAAPLPNHAPPRLPSQIMHRRGSPPKLCTAAAPLPILRRHGSPPNPAPPRPPPAPPWPLVHGPWPLVHGPWPLAPGPWPMAPGPWPLAHGPWPMAHGPWPIVLGSRRLNNEYRSCHSHAHQAVGHDDTSLYRLYQPRTRAATGSLQPCTRHGGPCRLCDGQSQHAAARLRVPGEGHSSQTCSSYVDETELM